MPRYFVGVSRIKVLSSVVEEAILEVEAEDEDDAWFLIGQRLSSSPESFDWKRNSLVSFEEKGIYPAVEWVDIGIPPGIGGGG